MVAHPEPHRAVSVCMPRCGASASVHATDLAAFEERAAAPPDVALWCGEGSDVVVVVAAAGEGTEQHGRELEGGAWRMCGEGRGRAGEMARQDGARQDGARDDKAR